MLTENRLPDGAFQSAISSSNLVFIAMKFIVSSSVLLKKLAAISGVIPTNPIVPILDNFLFRISDTLLTVTASDLQTTMTTELPVDVVSPGNMAVPAKLLMDTLRSLSEQPITFQIDSDTFEIQLFTDNGRFKIAGENPVDFPKIPTVSTKVSLELSSDALIDALEITVFATSTDDLRPAMTGVYLNLTAENATFVATDGHRLIRYRRSDIVGTATTALIIPRKALQLLKASLPENRAGGPVEVKAEFSQSNASFTFGPTQLICRLIDERFPDYENAIPTNNTNVMTIGRTDLLNSLKRIVIYANRTTHQIRLSLKASRLTISAEDLDYSNEASEKLLCDYEGDDMEIGFNAKLLIEMLGNLSAKMIKLEMSTANRAGLISPVDRSDDEDILMLAMPVMLNTYA